MNLPANNMDEFAALQQDLARRMRSCLRKARANYFFAYFLLVAAVASSAAATIAIAASSLPKELNAVLAAFPGIVVLTIGTFKFEARADWWYMKYHGLDALHRALTFEGRTVPEVSRDLSMFIRELEGKWPSFGKPPSGPGA